jgi:type I restriction enzyme S subunit
MKTNYKLLGDHIDIFDSRAQNHQTNFDLDYIKGISSISKDFIKTKANLIGVVADNYKVVEKNSFAFNPNTARMGDKIPIALNQSEQPILVSSIYPTFKIKDLNKLLPEYLMMWFCRPEFDRYARFKSHGSAREIFDWEEMCNVQLPIPSIEKQREIVEEYNTIQNRIHLNQNLIQNLESTAQAIYKEWFVDGIDKEDLPEGWRIEKLEGFTKMKYGKMLDSQLFLEKGYPVFSGYGVRGYYSEYMYEEPQVLVLCRGVSGTGEVRLSPRFSFITNLSIIVEIINPFISKMYLYYYLKNSDLKSLDSGSAQSMITTGDLYFQEALVPPYDLQKKFDEVTNIIMQEIEVNSQENKMLFELKDLLLSKLATV